MSAPTVITIKDATVKFWLDGGDETSAVDYKCQVSEASVNATPNLQTVPATFCAPESQVPANTGYELQLNWLQDWTAPGGGLSNFAFVNDAQLAHFALFLEDSNMPECHGDVWVVAGAFGGVAGVPLQASATWPLLGKPVIEVPQAVAATGATAGNPGTFQPVGATPPANLAALAGVTASPTTAWATGEHVVLGDASSAHWDGAAWAAGNAAVAREAATAGAAKK
jgi:hypothetical protein